MRVKSIYVNTKSEVENQLIQEKFRELAANITIERISNETTIIRGLSLFLAHTLTPYKNNRNNKT